MNCPKPRQWDLLAVGAVDGAAADGLRAHAEACGTCRQQYLSARRIHVELLRRYEVFDRDHDVLRDAMLAALPTETPVTTGVRPVGIRRLGDWIMSMNTKTTRRVAAVLAPAACIVVAVLVLLSPGPQKSAFAAAIERIRAARTIVAHFDVFLNQSEVPMQSGTLYLSDEHGMRFDSTADAAALPGVPGMTGMSMFHRTGGPVIMLSPGMKFAVRMHTPGKQAGWSGGWDQSSPDQFLAGFRKLTGEADAADARLDRSTLDGRQVEGFEISARKLGLEYVGSRSYDGDSEPSRARLFVDATTHLPVRMEVEMVVEAPPMGAMHVRAVYDDFEFDRPLDAAHFEPTIPDELRVFEVNVPAPSEETLLSALRMYAEKTGRYPLALDPSRISAELMIVLVRDGGVKVDPDDPSSVFSSDLIETVMRVSMGCAFTQQLARDGQEPEYFGDLVSPEDAAEVLLSWHLASGEIRVVYGDLQVENLPAK
jgi:hypothetical protein